MRKGKCNKCFYFNNKDKICFENLLKLLKIKRPGTYGCKKFESLELFEEELRNSDINF